MFTSFLGSNLPNRFDLDFTNLLNLGTNNGIMVGKIIQGKPEIPQKERIIGILDRINPDINKKFNSGVKEICVMINGANVPDDEFQAELLGAKIIKFEPNGNVIFGYNNKIDDCINDVLDGNLDGYILSKLENY